MAGRERVNTKIKSNYAVNIAPSQNEATIDIFGVIGVWWDGKDAQQFIEEISALDVDKININISSPGGFVDDALRIYDAIRSHKAFVTARLSGLVASAATWIACAADQVIASDTCLYMIHNVQGGAFGTKDDMRKAADVSEKMESVIVNLYRKKTGQRRAQLQSWMDAETWFTVDEAIEAGFIDKKGDGLLFDYQANVNDNAVRDFMTASLNCAKLPALEVQKDLQADDLTNKSQETDMEFTTEETGLLKRLVNFVAGNKAGKEEAPAPATNDVEQLTNQVKDLQKQLENKEKNDFTNLVNSIVEGVKVQLTEVAKEVATEVATEAANTATEALKAELSEVAESVNTLKTEKETATETANAINARVDEIAKLANEGKTFQALPEVKENNGEELAKTVTPAQEGTFLSFVKHRANQN